MTATSLSKGLKLCRRINGFGLPVLAAMERALTDKALRAKGIERACRFT